MELNQNNKLHHSLHSAINEWVKDIQEVQQVKEKLAESFEQRPADANTIASTKVKTAPRKPKTTKSPKASRKTT